MKKDKIIYWASTIIAMLTGAGTAFFYFSHPFFVEAFKHMGFPAYFRIELAVAKIVGIIILLVPAVPGRVKEWAYVGFAITFISGSIAHGVVDGFAKGAAPLISLATLLVSFYYFKKIEKDSSFK
jgi:hypothetical protein